MERKTEPNHIAIGSYLAEYIVCYILSCDTHACLTYIIPILIIHIQ